MKAQPVPAILAIIFLMALVVAAIGITIYGLVLAFSASVVLGIIALFVEPAPFIIGILGICGHADVCQRLATWLGL